MSNGASETLQVAQAQQEAVSEGIEAFELPRSIITRLARSAVREHFQFSSTF